MKGSIPEAWLPKCSMQRIILHWSEGWNKAGTVDREAYHILIQGDGSLVRGNHTIDDNVSTKDGDYAAHCLGCNTGSIGVALCGMVGCEERGGDGAAPINRQQWEAMEAVVAQLCKTYAIPVTPTTVLAHGEVQKNLAIKQRGKWDPMRWPWDRSKTGTEIMKLTRSSIVQKLSALALYLVLAVISFAQTLLVPAYSPEVGRKAAKEPNVCLIVNPNSGPGRSIDTAYVPLFKARCVAYVDLVAWPRDGIISVESARPKTVDELNLERDLYLTLYNHSAGWFFDDLNETTRHLVPTLVMWAGERILNPGCRSPVYPGFVTIQHETTGFLKAWLPDAASQRSQCGAMALGLPGDQLQAAWRRAKGLRYFYASPLTDEWRQGRTAYNTLPAYWPALAKLAR